jgi:hypothetical protein
MASPAAVDHAFSTTKDGEPVLLVPRVSGDAPDLACLQVHRDRGKAYLIRLPSGDVQELTGIDTPVLDVLLKRFKEILVIECHPAFFREDGESELAMAGSADQMFGHGYSALVVEHLRGHWWQFDLQGWYGRTATELRTFFSFWSCVLMPLKREVKTDEQTKAIRHKSPL